MRTRRIGWVFLGCLAATLAPGSGAKGQGFLVDRHATRHPVPTNRFYEVREVSIDARVRDQVAEVRVSQTFHNPGSNVIEAEYLFPLPDDSAVHDLVLMVDGKELPGRVLSKDEARRIYEEIVRSRRDPALVEYIGRGAFRASVFPIPPGADRKVTLRYTQLCKRDRDVVEFAYPLATQKHSAKPIGRLNLDLRIESRDAIKSIYCPSHDVTITRAGEREARVTLDRREIVSSNDFKLVYTLAGGSLGATVLSYRPDPKEDGYFLLLASPEVKPPDAKPLPKTVLFVVDRSGSMAGKKLEQARNAVQFVLNNLREGDRFNVIAYDDRVDSFRPEPQTYSAASRAEAESYVANIREGGSTNIDGALKAALAMIPDDSRPNYILFLTDGLPTAGEVRELKIAEGVRDGNRHHARVFAFGVGFDVNARLLDRISGGNGGTTEYVKPDEDLEAHVGAFYSKLTRPALASLSIGLEGSEVNRTYPRDLPDLFEGGQLVWVGRYPKSGRAMVKIAGRVNGEARSFEFPAELAGPGEGSGRDFVEKLWAVRRVGFIIDQIDLNGPNKELTDELVTLGTKYGLLTPYTSFLADEEVNLHAAAGVHRRRATSNLDALSVVQGEAGTSQRDMKQTFNKAERLEDVSKYAYSAPRASAGRMGGGMGGMGGSGMGGGGMGGGGMGASRAAGKPGQVTAMPGVLSEPGRPGNIRNLGVKTFYRKADRWVDSEVKPEDEARAIVVEQFSEAFFQLARGQSAEANQYISFEEPVTVRLGDKVYRIDPPK